MHRSCLITSAYTPCTKRLGPSRNSSSFVKVDSSSGNSNHRGRMRGIPVKLASLNNVYTYGNISYRALIACRMSVVYGSLHYRIHPYITSHLLHNWFVIDFPFWQQTRCLKENLTISRSGPVPFQTQENNNPNVQLDVTISWQSNVVPYRHVLKWS